MIHITDLKLNEYLDQVIDESMRHLIQTHIESCFDCRARLEELTLLNSTLKELKDISVPHDLTSSVLEQLPTPKSRFLNPFLAAQIGVALGTMMFIAMEIVQSVQIPSLSVFKFSIPAFRFNVSIFESLVAIPKVDVPQFLSLQIPQYNLQTSIAAISIIALGLIGNILLLHDRHEVRK